MTTIQQHIDQPEITADQSDQENLNHDPSTGASAHSRDLAQLGANNPPQEDSTPSAVESVESPFDDAKWRQHLRLAPYYRAELDYERDYLPAYRFGVKYKAKRKERSSFEEVEDDLKVRWEELKGESRLKWEQAKDVILDVWSVLFGEHDN